MANAVRGEVEIEGAGKRYVLVLDFNALCELEDHLDLGVGEIIRRLTAEEVRGGFLRSVLWGALRRNHPKVTLAQAGDLIQVVGAAPVMIAIKQALNRAFPAPDADADPEGEAAEGDADPMPDGTGPAS